MKTSAIKIVKTLALPKEVGTHYRLICMTGKNKGISYYINKNRIVLGRSDKADIQVLDTKSSREHLELVKVGMGYVLTDLDSQNGVVVNDLKVTQHNLVDGDRIIIGSTVFKFNKFVVEKKALEIVEEDDEDAEEDDDESEVLQIEDKSGKTKGAKGKDDNKRKKIIYGVVGLVLLYVLTMEDDKPKKVEEAPPLDAEHVDRSFINESKGSGLTREQEKQLKTIIHRGRREFREGNYFRAIQEFNLALIIAPEHGFASYLLNKTKQRLDEEITMNFLKARQESDSLKYMAASVAYCSIMRLLKDYKEDERYKEAEKQIHELEDKLGMLKGELNCL